MRVSIQTRQSQVKIVCGSAFRDGQSSFCPLGVAVNMNFIHENWRLIFQSNTLVIDVRRVQIRSLLATLQVLQGVLVAIKMMGRDDEGAEEARVVKLSTRM